MNFNYESNLTNIIQKELCKKKNFQKCIIEMQLSIYNQLLKEHAHIVFTPKKIKGQFWLNQRTFCGAKIIINPHLKEKFQIREDNKQ